MGRDEQAEEREVLDSIFADEITGTYHIISLCFAINLGIDISDTSYRISIPLQVVQQDDETEAAREYTEPMKFVIHS